MCACDEIIAFDPDGQRVQWITKASSSTRSAEEPPHLDSRGGCDSHVTTSDNGNAAVGHPSSTNLDFASHHQVVLNSSKTVNQFPSCDMSFSEYTPCQDKVRGRKFDRNMLKYRERHCPAKEELLRCLIPAPPQYKTPFKWPQSRDYANILTMSFAPRDTHEAQVQFALERGVPAMIGIMGSQRLPYPARAFDLAHCSRCLIPWQKYDGLYLAEVDRILRPGGYWVLSGPPIHWKKFWRGWERTREDLKQEQDAIEDVAKSLCWKKVIEKNDLSVWQKPINHVECLRSKKLLKAPHMCESDDPDTAWYRNLEACVTPLPEVSSSDDVAGGAMEKWPERASAVPPRIRSGSTPGITAERFEEDNKLWKERVAHYKRIISPLPTGRYRNIMDMNAYIGGFATAMLNYPVWVMNVVPIYSNHDTLGVIYERGLIGTYQDWCEAFSTYPRTYDLIHASGLFTLYQNCDITYILLDMDRILRPEGTVIFRDTVELLVKIQSITDGMRWKSQIIDHESGPFNPEKILVAVKTYWTGEATQKQL
ncbi:hypothetical protein GOBAR_AA12291 [Gossypium barbadense]|uniref:Methyltransferase n=1 Tax=Gossypium barbadense TaxID=3634 RepID=A0A2P5XYD9_GOSBA|nr:hypothetical protein GOBAR_AA12291 [Gossypium barbadense]